MAERIHNNPEREGMNNFHCHMPGGIYRLDEEHPKTSLADFMQSDFKKFEPILDDSEDTWPLEDRRYLRAIKTKRDIQRELDIITEQYPTLAERWSSAREFIGNGIDMNSNLREYLLRPFYVILREKFSEEDLSS